MVRVPSGMRTRTRRPSRGSRASPSPATRATSSTGRWPSRRPRPTTVMPSPEAQGYHPRTVSDRLLGLLLFLPVPIVLFLFTRAPLGIGWSLALGVVLMLTHRAYARPFALARASRRCLWCGRAAVEGPAFDVEEPLGITRWRACGEPHAERTRRFLVWAGAHRPFLLIGILGVAGRVPRRRRGHGRGLVDPRRYPDAVNAFRLAIAADRPAPGPAGHARTRARGGAAPPAVSRAHPGPDRHLGRELALPHRRVRPGSSWASCTSRYHHRRHETHRPARHPALRAPVPREDVRDRGGRRHRGRRQLRQHPAWTWPCSGRSTSAPSSCTARPRRSRPWPTRRWPSPPTSRARA